MSSYSDVMLVCRHSETVVGYSSVKTLRHLLHTLLHVLQRLVRLHHTIHPLPISAKHSCGLGGCFIVTSHELLGFRLLVDGVQVVLVDTLARSKDLLHALLVIFASLLIRSMAGRALVTFRDGAIGFAVLLQDVLCRVDERVDAVKAVKRVAVALFDSGVVFVNDCVEALEEAAVHVVAAVRSVE